MSITFSYDRYRRVVTNIPHALDLLESLGKRCSLKVKNMQLQGRAGDILHCILDVSALNALEAEQWAVVNCDAPLLSVQGPVLGARSGTLWFGQFQFPDHLPIFLLLELPFANRSNPNRFGSRLTLTVCDDPAKLDEWADAERERQAKAAVERLIAPLIAQAPHLGFSAVALGMRGAMEQLASKSAEDLMGLTAPELYKGWILAWTRSLAQTAPQLKEVSTIIDHRAPRGDEHYSPEIRLLIFFGKGGERVAVSPHMDREYWAGAAQAPIIEQLRAVTGAPLDSAIAVCDFLHSIAAVVRLQYRTTGVRRVHLSEDPQSETPTGDDSAEL